MILYWNIVNLISLVALNGRRQILVKSLFSTADAKSFFSEVGGGRSSRLSSALYIVLHESEQIEVGGVTGSLEPSCNTFFQFWGTEEQNRVALQQAEDDGNHTINIVEWKEDYQILQISFTNVFQDNNFVTNEKKILSRGITVDLEFLLGVITSLFYL